MYPKGYLTYTNFTAIVYPHPTCHIQAAGPIRRTSGRQSSEGWPPRAPGRVSAPEGLWGRQPYHRTVSSRLQLWRRKGGREGTKPLVPAGGRGLHILMLPLPAASSSRQVNKATFSEEGEAEAAPTEGEICPYN